jgi:YD repeat-containing protein
LVLFSAERKPGTADSTLRTDHVYDSFDRLIEQHRTDLTGSASQAVQVTSYEWSQFDQRTGFKDALGYRAVSSYDANGNQLSETDAQGGIEQFSYNAENRLLQRTDRLHSSTTTVYDAYGQRQSETDANGRVTTYQLGAFGQMLGSSTSFSQGYAALSGSAASSQTMRYDWQGRLAQDQDSLGKNLAYSYNDAGQQIRIADLALGKAVDYRYDALDRRVEETLSRDGLVQRHQSNVYNNQGWLAGVSADAGFDAGGGASLNQQLEVSYAFDASDNRVQVGNDQDQRRQSQYAGNDGQSVQLDFVVLAE